MKIDLNVDDQGFGTIQIEGVMCAVMPYWMLRPYQVDRVDMGSKNTHA